MSLVKKLKDILFEEEEYTEQIKTVEEQKEEKPISVKIEPEYKEEEKNEVSSEREIFKKENSFQFPDFDEDEFVSSISNNNFNNSNNNYNNSNSMNNVNSYNNTKVNIQKNKPNGNVLEYERKKTYEKRTDYGRYERIETREYTEKKKFKPSPIISPVYGILNQDYKAEDIVNKKEVSSTIDIDSVRKKAFETKVELKEEKRDIIDEPVVTFFEEKETIKLKEMPRREEYKSIDDLLIEASDEINLEDTLEIPKVNHLDAIEEELEKLEIDEKDNKKDLDDALDNDLFELIDSMYDDREED